MDGWNVDNHEKAQALALVTPREYLEVEGNYRLSVNIAGLLDRIEQYTDRSEARLDREFPERKSARRAGSEKEEGEWVRF